MLIEYDHIKKLLPITGIIHVGAYNASERKVYDVPVKWVEADPDLYHDLKARGLGEVYNFAATSYNGKAMLNRMPFKPANSLLEPHLNKRRSDVYVKDVIEVQARRIEEIQEPGFNFLNMDIQGGELKALHGVNFDYLDLILCEVHRVETYKNVPQVEDIDAYLDSKGFTGHLEEWTKYGWGDKLYVKK